MNLLNNDRSLVTARRIVLSIAAAACFIGIAANAQNDAAPVPVETQMEPKAAQKKAAEPETVQVFNLTNFSGQNDLYDLQALLRNMLRANLRIYAIPTGNAIVVRSTPEDLQLAQKLISAFDQYKKIYRLTYTINESDNGKRIGSQHFTTVVVSGAKTNIKQGSKVPIPTSGDAQKQEVQYLDIGLEIEVSVDGFKDGIRAHSKLVETSIAEDKAGVPDPVIRQTTLEGTSLLEEGKPLVLGSLDVPGSTRHQEIEVVSQLIH